MSRKWLSLQRWLDRLRLRSRASRQRREAAKRGLGNAWAQLNAQLLDAEEFPGAEGEYGLSSSNPIPCPNPASYFARLRSVSGGRVTLSGARFSVRSSVTNKPVDLYPVELDGKKISIYICIYAKRNSERAPFGFALDK